MGISQGYVLENGKKSQKLKFELISNLMVVPIEVNGSKLSFVLDSGVSNPILFNLTDQDPIQINKVSEISIKGLGNNGEPIRALSSRNNTFRLGNAVNRSQHLYVVLDKDINFSPSLGVPVHGIIGYDLFRDFVVDINYTTKTIRLYDPAYHTYKAKEGAETRPLAISKKKAYMEVEVLVEGNDGIPVKMLVDTGSSDAVWLFENDRIDIPDRNYDDFLGKGLSGNIFGKRAIVKHIKIGNFVLYNTKAAFPHKSTFGDMDRFGDRNGSLGGEVLKRFNMVVDYPNNRITLRKNANFGKPYQYNLSGIEHQHDGLRYVSDRITDPRGVGQ